MKKIIFKLSFATLFAIVSLFAAKTAYSQVPDAINFQAIARDASGEVLANTEIMLQLTILDGSAEGTEVYREVRTLTTNNYGSFSFQIGRDVTEFEGDFSAIDWSADDKFIKIDYDPTASSNFELSLGTIEFVTVPYAFTARDVVYIDATGAVNGDVLVFDEETGKFKPGQVATTVAWGDIQGKPTTIEGYGITDAFSGDYGDLEGAPVLNIDNWNTAYSWNNHAGLYRPIDWVPTWDEINEKPDFAEVATTGNYGDLEGAPDLATVATSGNYSDLNEKPTDLGEFTNEAGYLKTETQTLSDVLNKGTDAGGENITNLANPTGDQDAATKFYVDDKVNTLGEEVDALENTVSGLSDNVSNLTTTVDGLTTNVGNLTTNLGNLANDVEALETDLDDLSDNLDANVNALLARIDTLEFFFTDTRDSNVYRTVQIGNQIWMAENLKYLPSVIGPGTGSNTDAYYYVNGYDGTSVSVAKATENYATYGVLYNFSATMNACPEGWHLPSDTEWQQLEMYLGMTAEQANTTGWRGTVEGGKLKEVGTVHWNSPNAGASNESGFTALPGGYRPSGGGFYNIRGLGSWWTSSNSGYDNYAWGRNLSWDKSEIDRNINDKSSGFSVRCIKNASDDWTSLNNTPTTLEGYGITDATLANVLAQSNDADNKKITNLGEPTAAQDAATKAYVDALETTVNTLLARIEALEIVNNGFTDARDNNHYNAVKIGEQIWMAENLAYKPSSGNYWAYDDDDTNVAIYGYLYDWNTAMNGAGSSATNPSNVQGICPEGWHLPSDEEWTILTDYLGGNTGNAGGKLKEAGEDHWQSPNEGANNESGFTALPGGRYDNGYFDSIGYYGHWWSATEDGTDSAWFRLLGYGNGNVGRYGSDRESGFSVRCVRD